MKAAPDKSHIFLTRGKFSCHMIEVQKPRLDAILKLQTSSNKKKLQEFLGMSNFLSKYVH